MVLRVGAQLFYQNFHSDANVVDQDDVSYHRMRTRVRALYEEHASPYALQLADDVTWIQVCGKYPRDMYHFEIDTLPDKSMRVIFQHPDIAGGQALLIFDSAFEPVPVSQQEGGPPRTGFMQFVDPALGSEAYAARVIVLVDYSQPNKMIVDEISFEFLYRALLRCICGDMPAA